MADFTPISDFNETSHWLHKINYIYYIYSTGQRSSGSPWTHPRCLGRKQLPRGVIINHKKQFKQDRRTRVVYRYDASAHYIIYAYIIFLRKIY